MNTIHHRPSMCMLSYTPSLSLSTLSMQMNPPPPPQQHGQQQAAARPMSVAMGTACCEGRTADIRTLLDEGEGVDCVNSSGMTGLALTLWYGHVESARLLLSRGADLSRVTSGGSNMLHYAAGGGDRDCIELVCANSTIDVNSTTPDGDTPLMWSMYRDILDASNQLVEHGANLFKKNTDGIRAIDLGSLGPQVLQHGKDLRWASVLPLALLHKACAIDTNPPKKSSNPPQRRSSRIQAPIQAARLAASVFGNPDIAQHMSAFFLRTEIIVRDPSIPRASAASNAANQRVEEWLASSSSSSSNKKARK
jgi:ankyrin repeat protein